MRKKIGEKMAAIGFIAFLIFGSAIDGPNNNMVFVYMGCISSIAVTAAGATLGKMWN